MELIDTILNRRSVRQYNNTDISEGVLNDILEAGLLAPSSRNKRPVEFVAVKDKSILKSLSKAKSAGSSMLADASCAIVVIGDSEKSDVWVEDCSIAMTYMMLRATELGTANCWVQIRRRETENGTLSEMYIRELLSIPDKYGVLAVLSIGMSDKTPTPHTVSEVDFSKVHEDFYKDRRL